MYIFGHRVILFSLYMYRHMSIHIFMDVNAVYAIPKHRHEAYVRQQSRYMQRVRDSRSTVNAFINTSIAEQ